jgi:hypothetical protein
MDKTFRFQDDAKDLELKDYVNVWRTGVYEKDGEAFDINMEDALAHPNSTQFFPITVETLVREAIEPVLIGTSLLERISYRPGMQVSFPSIGAIVADDVNEAGEYPEYSLNFGPGSQIITIGKCGLAIKFTDEMKRYSQYDVLSMYLKAMGRALARHKESKIFAMLSGLGVVTHDNHTPSASVHGVTRGRSVVGAANGAVTMDDLHEAFGTVLMNGFTPNAILVHPLTYTMFLTDALLRAFALTNGSGAWYNGWTGNGQAEYPWSRGAQGKLGPGGATVTSSSDPKTIQVNAAPKLPNYAGLPLQVIVSPFIPYNHSTKLTDIYMVDTNNIGAIIVDEEPTMEELPDRYREITKIKIRERYAIAPFNEGRGVAVLKNIKVTPNELIMPVQGTVADITAITRSGSLY